MPIQWSAIRLDSRNSERLLLLSGPNDDDTARQSRSDYVFKGPFALRAKSFSLRGFDDCSTLT